MKKLALVCLTLSLLVQPRWALGQDLGIGARAGTWGVGAEGALSLTDYLALRGGVGSFFFEFDGEMDDVDYTVTPPSLTGTVGIDFYPSGGSFRLVGGVMFRNGDVEMETGDLAQEGGIEIGNAEYTEAGSLFGTVASKSAAPYAGFGFGRHTSGGFGVFFDLGVAFVGDPDVTLRARGALADAPGIQENLDLEAQKIEDDTAPYLKYWPVLNFGLKIPVG